MTQYAKEDIRGIRIENKCYCSIECAEDAGEDITQNDIIINNSDDDNIYFCDNCDNKF